MVMGRRAKPEAKFKIGQPVIITSDGERLHGRITKFLDNGKVRCGLASGGKANYEGSQLDAAMCETPGCTRPCDIVLNRCNICVGIRPEDSAEEVAEEQLDNEKKGGREMAFVQYEIEWKQRKNGKKPRNFTCDVPDQDLHFYGYWRKTRNVNTDQIFYAIDLFARRAGHDYTCESIYYETNPLKNQKSLNADICAAMNKFLHQTVNGHAESIDNLQARARFPVIRIKRLATIDQILLKLREIRDTSIRAGGERLIEIHGDEEDKDAPRVRFILNLTTQAMGMKGRVPSLLDGGMFDKPIQKGAKHGERLKLIPSEGNVQALVKALKEAKEKDDQPLARKIRATLRKMGHRGGGRSLEKKAKEKK